eukprot:11242105-Alexandrium_andersonii.AAC.1
MRSTAATAEGKKSRLAPATLRVTRCGPPWAAASGTMLAAATAAGASQDRFGDGPPEPFRG